MFSTFRFKISVVAALVVIALTIVFYLLTVSPLSSAATEGVEKSVQRARRLVERSQKLQAFEVLSLAQRFAEQTSTVRAVQIETEKQRRINVFDVVDQQDKLLRKQGRKPDFLGVVDKQGAVIARDLDINNMYGETLPYKSVGEALKGQGTKDIWSIKNKMMRAAAAPITEAGKVLGAVVIAYEITAKDAREERDLFGTHVAYFMNNAIRASSFSLPTDDSTEDAELVGALNKALLGSDKSPGRVAIAEDKTSDVLPLTAQEQPYKAITAPLPIRLTNKSVGYVVLASVDSAQEPVSRVRWMFLAMGLLTLVIVLGSMFLVAKHYVNEEDKLELGVNEVINGNLEYTFEGVQEFEGLANAFNVMLARLLGRPEPGEEEDQDAAWRADVLFVENVTGEHYEAALVAQLGAEPEDAYCKRVFEEYVEARRKFNLPVEGITEENLTQKLKANEAIIKAKHDCSAVRFVVKAEMGKVSLKPIRIP